MHLKYALVAAIATTVFGTAPASAAIFSVDGRSGPWDISVAGNLDYGAFDALSATSVNVSAGTNVTITYLDGLTDAFGGPPSVDALGYAGSIFGSGVGKTGIGSSGSPFPSFLIDPGNTGPEIALNALIGAFVNSSGLVLQAFAPGLGPFSLVAPSGATQLLLGVNDDIFGDNSGALRIEVTVGSVPEPETYALLLAGLGLLGFAGRRKKLKAA